MGEAPLLRAGGQPGEGAGRPDGQVISNASSIRHPYAIESHYVTVGKKIGGLVLHVAARVVSEHSLNVMAGHDDVYCLLSSGYTILFGANPQEAADLAAIAYRTSALSLIPVADAIDGFATSHMLSEALMPEPELLREYLGDPAGRSSPLAQELLFGAERVFQLNAYLARHRDDFGAHELAELTAWLDARRAGRAGQRGGPGRRDGRLVSGGHPRPVAATVGQRVREGHWPDRPGPRRRQQPRLTDPVQNQPEFQAGSVDHRTHFASAVPTLVRGDGGLLGALRPQLRPGAQL